MNFSEVHHLTFTGTQTSTQQCSGTGVVGGLGSMGMMNGFNGMGMSMNGQTQTRECYMSECKGLLWK